MKKLMIATAIVCAVAMSQAASISWQFTDAGSAYDRDGSVIMDGGVYAYFMIDSASITGDENTYAYNTALAAVQKGDASFVADNHYNGSGIGDELWGGDYYGSNDGLALGEGNKEENLNYVNAYLVLVDTNVDDGKDPYVYISELATVGIDSNGNLASGAVEGAVQFSNANMESGWYTTSAVPEPTSGLLLLLGVAGLALRRRRA